MNNYKNKILNLGCGKGQNIPSLLHRGELTCVDIDAKSISLAKKKFPQCHFLVSSGENLDLPPAYFNEIYCYDVLEHVNDLPKVMENLRRFIHPKGRLYVEVPFDRSEKMLTKINPHYPLEIGHRRVFQFSRLQDDFKKFGFQVLKIRRERGIVNYYLSLLFVFKIHLTDEMGTVGVRDRIIERILLFIEIWFDKNIFNTPLKYFPLWIITLPIGHILSQIYPKTIAIDLVPN